MGTLNVSSPQNMLSGSFWIGAPEDVFNPDAVGQSTTRITISPDFKDVFVEWVGSFQIDSFTGDITGGTIRDFTVFDPTLAFSGTGFSLDLNTQFLPSLLDDQGNPATSSERLVQVVFAGDDELNGSGGADTMVGMNGNDGVSGNDGDDDVNGNIGNDTMSGGAGADFVRGGQNEDIVHGEDGDDWHVNGNIGNDQVFGDAGNDTMFGGQGNDTLAGGEGDDRMDGNLGDDVLGGGAGADLYLVFSGGGDDRIVGFADGQDRIAIQSNINGTNVTSFATLQPRLSADGQGGTAIDLGGGNSLIVGGIAPGALGAADFLFL